MRGFSKENLNLKGTRQKTRHCKVLSATPLKKAWCIINMLHKRSYVYTHGIQSYALHGKQMGKMWKLSDFIFLGFKIKADSDCSHKIKRCLLLGRIAMTNLDSILKSRDNTLLTKVCLVKAMVFPVVMCRCESWTIKKADHQRIDVFDCCTGEDS